MPSEGQKFPPQANPHLRKTRTTSQFILGTPHCGLVEMLRSMAMPQACRDGAPNDPPSLL